MDSSAGRVRAILTVQKQCVICQTATRELYLINSLHVCLPCIADDGWFLKMQADREAVVG
jgi:hypothetical protein